MCVLGVYYEADAVDLFKSQVLVTRERDAVLEISLQQALYKGAIIVPADVFTSTCVSLSPPFFHPLSHPL